MTSSDAASHSTAQCEQAWQAYCDSWSATTASERQAILERGLSPTFTMTGDHATYTGYDGLQAAIVGFQGSIPGASFNTLSVKAHHGYGKAEWEALNAEGKVVMSGVDFLTLAADGRIEKAVAFLN